MALFTDTQGQMQPEGTYAFALNMIKDSSDGAMQVLTSANANRKVVDTDTIVGAIPLNGLEVVIFTAPGGIYLFNGTDYTLLQDYPEFNFSRFHPITGLMRTVNGCERIIYWCDGNNEDRYYNIDRPERFDSIEDFSFTPNVTYPEQTTTIQEGGTLDYGTYRFVVELLDANENVVLRTLPGSEVFIGTGINDGRPTSTKRIDVTVSNLDVNFTSLRVGVLRFVSGDGLTPTAHYIGDPIVISDDTVTIQYTGFRPDNGESLINFRTLLTPIINFTTSHTMTTVHGRLLRGNLVEQTYDFSTFQQYASKITTRYVTEQVPVDERSYRRTEHGDSIRDYGIVYVTRQGTLSPRFHIPGRAKNDLDDNLTSGALIGVEGLVEQWRIQNTSERSTGLLGYYESTENYTTPVNYCSDNDYWGVDDEGNSLLNTPIRYHRIPDRSSELLYDGTQLNYIGVQFSNIEYPHPDIVGHFITDNVDDVNLRINAGYFIPFNDSPDNTGDKKEGRYIHYLPNAADDERQTNTNFQHFINITHLTQGTVNRGSLTKLLAIPISTYEDNRPTFSDVLEDGSNVALYGKHHSFGAHSGTTVFNPIEDIFSLDPSTSFRGNTNRSKSSTFQIVEHQDVFATFNVNSPNVVYGYIASNTPRFPNRLGVRHRMFSGYISGAADTTVFNGHAFISKLDITNVSSVSAPSGNLVGIEYEYLQNLFTESYEQFDLRHELPGDCNYFVSEEVSLSGVEIFRSATPPFPGFELVTLAYNSVEGVILSRVLAKVKDDYRDSWQFKAGVCPEYYGYNDDYSPTSLTTLPSLAYNYDYCSACIGSFPVTISYSEVAADEDINDSWRVQKPLNTTTIPSDKGEIRKMDFFGNRLVIRTVTGCYIMSPNPQQIQLTDTTAFLGTGTFLSIPAQEFDGSDSGYGGQQSVLGSVITPGGLFWSDEITGKVFRFTDQISEVSRNGMYHFFENRFTKPNDHDYGRFGAIMYYDPKFEMVYVTSKQFQQINTSGNDRGSENLSFTLSYGIRDDRWISYHSFTPGFAFHLAKTFYTTVANNIYAHDDYSRFANYYGTSYDVGIQYTFTGQQTMQWDSVHYYATVMKYNPSTKQWEHNRDRTFDRAIAFTNLQSSGFVDLRLTKNPYEQVQWSTTVKNVLEADQNYRIGSLRDVSTAHPVISSNWEAIQGFYNGDQGYIDHVPVNINYDLPMYQQVYLRDKFIHLRMFFKDETQRILVYYATIRKLPTLR